MSFHVRPYFLSADFVCNLYLLPADFFYTKHSPVQHHLSDLFSPRVLGDLLQTNPFFLFIVTGVSVSLLSCVTVVRPARRFLLDFKPGVDIICEEPHPSVLFAEIPHPMNFNDTITELPLSIRSWSVWGHRLVLSSQGFCCSSWTQAEQRGKVSLQPAQTGSKGCNKCCGA